MKVECLIVVLQIPEEKHPLHRLDQNIERVELMDIIDYKENIVTREEV